MIAYFSGYGGLARSSASIESIEGFGKRTPLIWCPCNSDVKRGEQGPVPFSLSGEVV